MVMQIAKRSVYRGKAFIKIGRGKNEKQNWIYFSTTLMRKMGLDAPDEDNPLYLILGYDDEIHQIGMKVSKKQEPDCVKLAGRKNSMVAVVTPLLRNFDFTIDDICGRYYLNDSLLVGDPWLYLDINKRERLNEKY